MQSNPNEQEYSARRIHHTLGGTTPFVWGYTLGELGLFVGVAFVTLVAAALVPATFTLPVIGFGVMLVLFLGLLHKVKPDYLWLTEWLAARLGWAVRHTESTHAGADSDTRYLTRVNRVFPHGIERSDGALVGAVQIEPANMALEDDEAWGAAVRSLSEFVNATIDFPVTVYITSREVAQDEVVRAHQDRLADADVRSRPVLKHLLEESIASYTDANGDIDAETTTIREYYLITAVRDADVEQVAATDDSVLAYLSDVPGIGRVVDRCRPGELSAGERDQLKEDKLASRLSRLRREGTSLYRCSVRPVDAYDLARITKEYWSGRPEAYDDITSALGTFPVVTHGLSDEVPSTPAPEDVVEAMDASHSTDRAAGNGYDERHTEWEDSGDDSGDDTEAEAPSDEAAPETASEEQLDEPSTMHQSVLAPTTVDWEPTYAVINDDTYVRTFWIEQFPEEPATGMFERLLLETDLQTDLSIHLDPFDTQSAADMMADWIADLKVNQHDATSLKAEDLQADIDRGKYMRSLVRANEASFYRGGVFIRLSADSKQALETNTTRLRSLLKDAPANCTLKEATRWQEQGLATVSPLGANELGQDRLSTMTNQAIGAMFPFSSNYLMMDDGIEYGYHGHNGSPIRINPMALDTGLSELIVGMPGAGKTFGTIMRLLRMLKRRQDTMLVLVDPVGGFEGIAEALDAEVITVGGNTRLNPLEMRQTPPEVLNAESDGRLAPVSAKKDEVFAILENFLRARGVTLDTETGVLSYVIDEAYRQSDIIEGEISTHTPANSPTMADVLRILSDIADYPQEQTIAASGSARELAASYADELAIALQPFQEGGVYENLSQPSEIDILDGDDKVVYIDLGQIEGSAAGIDRQSFLMQLLFSTIYQQAKRTDRTVELAIDEAHYLFGNQANLDFLETAFRHQRHAGLRMVLLSQSLHEFYETEQAEKMMGMCPIKVFHRYPEIDTTPEGWSESPAAKVGLTREQCSFVADATAGKDELGYAQALVHVEEHGTYPVHVVADAFEQRVIEYDAADRAVIEQALSTEPEDLVDFEQVVEREAQLNALVNRFDLEEERATRIIEEGFTQEELAAVAQALANGTEVEEPRVRSDGGNGRDESDRSDTRWDFDNA